MGDFLDKIGLAVGCRMGKPVDTSVTAGGPVEGNYFCSVIGTIAENFDHAYTASVGRSKTSTVGSLTPTEGMNPDNTNTGTEYDITLGKQSRSVLYSDSFYSISGSESGIGMGELHLEQPMRVDMGSEFAEGNKTDWNYIQVVRNTYKGIEARYNRWKGTFKVGISITSVNPKVSKEEFRQWFFSSAGFLIYGQIEIGHGEKLVKEDKWDGKIGLDEFLYSTWSDVMAIMSRMYMTENFSASQANAQNDINDFFGENGESPQSSSMNDVQPIQAVMAIMDASGERDNIAFINSAKDPMRWALLAKEAAKVGANVYLGSQEDSAGAVPYFTSAISTLNYPLATNISQKMLKLDPKFDPIAEAVLAIIELSAGLLMDKGSMAGTSLKGAGASSLLGIAISPYPGNEKKFTEKSTISYAPFSFGGKESVGAVTINTHIKDTPISVGITGRSPAASLKGAYSLARNAVKENPADRTPFAKADEASSITPEVKLWKSVKAGPNSSLELGVGGGVTQRMDGGVRGQLSAEAHWMHKSGFGVGLTVLVDLKDASNPVALPSITFPSPL